MNEVTAGACIELALHERSCLLSSPREPGYDAGRRTRTSAARQERDGSSNMAKSAISSTRKHLLAVLMAAVFAFATTVCLAHIDTKSHGSSSAPHCEICLAWSGGTVSPSIPDVVPAFVSLAWLVPYANFQSAWVHRQRSSHRSRAPPQHI